MRAYLLTLVLGVALPLIVLLAATLYWSARVDERQASGVAMQLARIAAEETSRLVADTRTLLTHLAERPRVRALDAHNCDDILDQYVVAFPVYANRVPRPDRCNIHAARRVP